MFHVYLSPEHAGKSTATLASWYVDDVEGIVDEPYGVEHPQWHEEPRLRASAPRGGYEL